MCVVLDGDLTVHTPDKSLTPDRYNLALLESGEDCQVENTGSGFAVGLDVFAPD
jgi:hypothetical protein